MYSERKWNMTVEEGDIWRRRVQNTLSYAYFLILKRYAAPHPTMPYGYKLLPLTPHLDSIGKLEYEAPLNHWSEWEKVV
jgi:hypothetical protein